METVLQAAATVAVAVIAAVGASRTARRDRDVRREGSLIDQLQEQVELAESRRARDLTHFTELVEVERHEVRRLVTMLAAAHARIAELEGGHHV